METTTDIVSNTQQETQPQPDQNKLDEATLAKFHKLR